MSSKTSQTIAWILVIIGSVTSLFFLAFAIIDNIYYSDSTDSNYAVTGQIGDFIGGLIGTIFSLAGFIYLYLTFKKQQESFDKERFESVFFELVRFHRDNVRSMIHSTKVSKGEELNWSGAKYFELITYELIAIKDDLRPFFTRRKINQIYQPQYLTELTQELNYFYKEISLKEKAKIDIEFSIVFYGLSNIGKKQLTIQLKRKYKPDFVDDLVAYIALKPLKTDSNFDKWRKIQAINSFENRIKKGLEIVRLREITPKEKDDSLNEEIKEFFYRDEANRFYSGHQVSLSHYFRHLYQLVNYVDDQNNLNYNSKYSYVKILRAQITSYEQAILYYNSISSVGDIWELCAVKRFDLKQIDRIKVQNKQLITKYNLIKNLAAGQLLNIRYQNIYSNVTFEGLKKTSEKIELEKQYY